MERRRKHFITNASIRFQGGLIIVADHGLFLNLFMVCLFCVLFGLGLFFFFFLLASVSLCHAKRSHTLTGQFITSLTTW